MADSARSEIEARYREFIECFEKDDCEAVVGIYAPNVKYYPHQRETINGTTDSARSEIEARYREFIECFDKGDCEAVVGIYAPDVKYYPHQGETINGTTGLKAVFEKLMPAVKKLVIQEITSFELLNDTTACVAATQASLDKDGKPWALYRDLVLWKKVDGVWYASQVMFNGRPM